jgi:D-tyrosyl-tRNA(Tyr) deacylase
VTVAGEVVGQIGPGLVALVGVTHDDSEAISRRMAEKTIDLRIFEDAEGRMNRSMRDLVSEGSAHGILVVSQFTLYADARKGRRPSFTDAARQEVAEPLVSCFAGHIREAGAPVQQGRFGAEMLVRLENDGPVTIWLDSRDLSR